MIRYNNRFKAGTRRNKKWTKQKGADRYVGIQRDSVQCGFTKEPCSTRINPGKPQHELRYHDISIITTSIAPWMKKKNVPDAI